MESQFIVRGFPISITLEFLENRLIEKGYTSDEIEAKVSSIYTNNIFRKKLMDTNIIIMFVLWSIVLVMLTYIICTTILKPNDSKNIVNVGNSTNSTLGMIKCLKYLK
jgi:hypothetical protein